MKTRMKEALGIPLTRHDARVFQRIIEALEGVTAMKAPDPLIRACGLIPITSYHRVSAKPLTIHKYYVLDRRFDFRI
jgi:hypothetical protein